MILFNKLYTCNSTIFVLFILVRAFNTNFRRCSQLSFNVGNGGTHTGLCCLSCSKKFTNFDGRRNALRSHKIVLINP